MSEPAVIIAGGGIGGLATALTLEQIGVPCLVLESARELKPLGVGINIQPNAVRELYALGFTEHQLDSIGLPAKEWALVARNGKDIYAEPRGLLAGYRWPQYSVHRGKLQMLLYQAAIERLGSDAIRTGMRVTGYRNNGDDVTVFVESRNGETSEISAALLIGADGLHSVVRSQMYPNQPPVHWGGMIIWRGTTRAVPIRTGASFVALGTHLHRVILYPITPADPDTGLATINWVAEFTVDPADGLIEGDWNKKVSTESFIHYFEGWDYDWIDIPGLLRGAEEVFEYPMIDREPVPTWVDGRVALMGDAAHIMYPTGSNGGSQAIVDARVLGAAMIRHGVSPASLEAFNAELCADISKLVLLNRDLGPVGLLRLVEERCGGVFDHIDDVIPPTERYELMANYKEAAGFGIESLNKSPPIIAPGASVSG
jgi:2-polyprenyl-6-methoxyphenol hydroxylase-like FAD-dependent oxidoreductase